MRTAAIALALSTAATAPAAADAFYSDPVHAYQERWPNVAFAIQEPVLAYLFYTAPCSNDPDDMTPAIHAGSPSLESPDGKTLLVIATIDDSAAAASALHVPAHTAVVALAFDGPAAR